MKETRTVNKLTIRHQSPPLSTKPNPHNHIQRLGCNQQSINPFCASAVRFTESSCVLRLRRFCSKSCQLRCHHERSHQLERYVNTRRRILKPLDNLRPAECELIYHRAVGQAGCQIANSCWEVSRLFSVTHCTLTDACSCTAWNTASR